MPIALTNFPATKNLVPLVAHGREEPAPPTKEEPEMADNKTLMIALGLRPDANDTEAMSFATKLRDFQREVLQLSGKDDPAEALGVLRAHAQAQTQLVQLQARNAELEGAQRAGEFDRLVASGSASGQLTPAMLKGEWLTQLRSSEGGAKQLKAFLATAPKVELAGATKPAAAAQNGETSTGPNDVVAHVTFSADEMAMAKLLQPHREKEVLERVAKFRASGGRVPYQRGPAPADEDEGETATA